MTRTPFPHIWMAWARTLADGRSTCPRLHVGAVAVSPDNVPIMAGYNGAASGQPHCTDVGCLLDGDGHCRRSVHAERNVINNAARHGISLAGATLYVTHQPCSDCLLSAWSAGIHHIVYDRAYANPLSEFLLPDGMTIEHINARKPLRATRCD